MPRTPRAEIHARIDQELHAALQRQAANENMTFPEWLRANLPRLVKEYPGRIVVEEGIPMPSIPMTDIPLNGEPPYPYPYYNYPPPQSRRGYYGYPMPKRQTQMDKMLEDMMKMYQVKLFSDLLKGVGSPEDFVRAAKGEVAKGSTDFDWNQWMKMQMFQSQQEMQMMKAREALELARSKGDKTGEQTALNMITALSTATIQQGQQFLQQYIASQQAQSQSQQNLFTTALQVSRDASKETLEQRTQQDARFDQLRQEFWQGQLANVEKYNQLQVENLKGEMTRIASEKKDWVEKLDEFVQLREKSPVYKAVFDATFGVKEESTLGKLIPQLKELGLDRFLEKVGGALTQFVIRPKAVPPPSPIMIPPPAQITPPSSRPTHESAETASETPLEELSLPASSEQTEEKTETKFRQPQPPETPLPSEETIGYSNLEKMATSGETEKPEKTRKKKK